MVLQHFCNYNHQSHCIAEVYSYIFLQLYSFLNTGKDIDAQSSGSVRVKKDGLHLYISPVTAASEGEYVCLVKEDNMEMIRMYNITVAGELHASLLHALFILFTHKHSGLF